jgi:8-amino-7-oxononanoate synthase
MDQKLRNKLAKREEEGTKRSLSLLEGYVDFFSNDYLGLAKKVSDTRHSKSGSGGSRLIAGNSSEAEHCEKILAEKFKSEAALVFNSGYDANLGFFACVPQKGDTVIYDQHIHASARDGIRLGFAESFSFRHNNLADLEKKIILAKGTVYVAVEALYSMNGDFADLDALIGLSERFGAYLVVDDAHSGGTFGVNGVGLTYGKKVFARLLTFGKAFGSHGAAILGSNELKEYLINFSRSFIYSTALPASHFNEIVEKVNSGQINQQQVDLKRNIEYFRSFMPKDHLLSAPNSPIQMIGNLSNELLRKTEKDLQQKKMAVKAIFPPTVPQGQESLRVCLHAFNTEIEIENLAAILLYGMKK